MSDKRHSDTYYRRKAEGVCTHCGGPLDGHGLKCDRCRRIQAIKRHETYEMMRLAGLCTTCGRKAVPGRVQCAECLERDNMRAKEKYLRKQGGKQ